MTDVTITRIQPANEHERQKWFVLQGSIDGCPAVTKRTSIAVAALVSRPELLTEARSKLVSDVSEYYANYLALEKL